MKPISRRDILAVGAAGGLMAASSAAMGQTSPQVPQPNRAPGFGGTDPGPRDLIREKEDPDLLNPPSTDSGTLPNLRFSFADAHTRQTDGGWTRQVTQRELPISTTLAGVEMRLNAGGIREMHWHKQAEWAYMLSGAAHHRD
jgi:oxalate decarboxylase